MATEREAEKGNHAAGVWLQKLRTDADLSQESLAEACGVSVDTIRSYEAGRRTPSRETIERILRHLNVPDDLVENHIRWFRNLSLPPDWIPWDKWASVEVAFEAEIRRSLSPMNKAFTAIILVIAISIIGIFALRLRQPTSFNPLETSPAPALMLAATPTGIRKFLGIDCKQYGFFPGQNRTVVEVCAWVNLDYDNHRLRGRATIKHVAGPMAQLAIPAVRLKQNGQVIRSSSKELIAQEQQGLESYTELLDCGEDGPVTTEIVAVVTYQDGQQREYTLTSEEVEPRC
jgi:transcriptional regulator with XRE-family HTH domain